MKSFSVALYFIYIYLKYTFSRKLSKSGLQIYALCGFTLGLEFAVSVCPLGQEPLPVLAVVGFIVGQPSLRFLGVGAFVDLPLLVDAIFVVLVVFALVGAPRFLVSFVVGFVSHARQLKQTYHISQIFSHTEIYMKGGADEKADRGGWRPFGNVDYPAALTMAPAPWFGNPDYPAHLTMAPASGLGLHGSGCRIRWGGLALAGPRSLHPDPLRRPPET